MRGFRDGESAGAKISLPGRCLPATPSNLRVPFKKTPFWGRQRGRGEKGSNWIFRTIGIISLAYPGNGRVSRRGSIENLKFLILWPVSIALKKIVKSGKLMAGSLSQYFQGNSWGATMFWWLSVCLSRKKVYTSKKRSKRTLSREKIWRTSKKKVRSQSRERGNNFLFAEAERRRKKEKFYAFITLHFQKGVEGRIFCDLFYPLSPFLYRTLCLHSEANLGRRRRRWKKTLKICD